MTLDEIIENIIAVEDEISDACDQGEFDKAEELTQKRITLLKEISSLNLSDEEKAKFLEFAGELKSHLENQIKEFDNAKEQTRLELFKYKHGEKGMKLYREIRRSRK